MVCTMWSSISSGAARCSVKARTRRYCARSPASLAASPLLPARRSIELGFAVSNFVSIASSEWMFTAVCEISSKVSVVDRASVSRSREAPTARSPSRPVLTYRNGHKLLSPVWENRVFRWRSAYVRRLAPVMPPCPLMMGWFSIRRRDKGARCATRAGAAPWQRRTCEGRVDLLIEMRLA